MSEEITVGHSEEYSSNVRLLSQQMDSRFRGAVTVESLTGKSAQMMNQIGSVIAQKRTTRHADTPLIPTPHDSRWVFPEDYEWADLIDKQDRRGVRGIVDFESPYVRNGAAAMNRAMDDEIMAAFFSDTTKTGEDHGTTNTWTAFVAANAGHQITTGGGLTAAKLKAGLKAFRAANVDLTNEPVFCAVSSEEIEDLHLEDQYINFDYSNERALNSRAAGEIKPFLGVRFIHYEDLPTTGGARRVPLWVPSGMGLGIFDSITGRVSERDDKSYAMQVYTCGTFGATRLEEEKVVEIQCSS